MSKSAGLSKLGPPNLHERRRMCVCAPPTPVREHEDGEALLRCLKCGYEIEETHGHGD